MSITNMDTKVVTGKVRLSYCHLFSPDEKSKYGCTILIPKEDKDTLAKIKRAIESAKVGGVKKLGDKNGVIPKTVKTSVHDGDGEKPNGGEYGEECKGHYVINASSTQKPAIVDKSCNEILDSTAVYSGCYARVSVNFYAYNTDGNKGIACGLNNIQKLADGDYLGGRSAAKDDFKDDFFSDEPETDDGLLGQHMAKKIDANQTPKLREVNPMTVKEYTEWYIANYNVDPPIRFLKTCIDNYMKEEPTQVLPTQVLPSEVLPSEDDEWLNELLGDDDTEDWLK